MYVKLFAKILDSSIWLESDSTVRGWITLLASMDSEGFCCFGSINNLASRANVSPRRTAEALEALDEEVAKVTGGWLVKAYADYIVKEHRIPISEEVRIAVLERCGCRCVRCGDTELLEIDHILAWSKGGTDDPENLQALCRTCNRKKGAR